MNSSKAKAIKRAVASLGNALKSCSMCPRQCRVNRLAGIKGYCEAPLDPVVYSFAPHHGEEPPISGRRGSGTIFFSHCSMTCAYCQNYLFSQLKEGKELGIAALADMMLRLKEKGCHNINLVSPTHFIPQILAALEIAVENGLDIPIVYNTSGYEMPQIIRLLEGVIDIYLADMRYSDDTMAMKYSNAPDYVEYNRASIVEMQRQVQSLQLDNDGTAIRGLIIRLLVLPERISGTIETLKFIKESVSDKTFLSLMSQYYPAYKARDHKEISRRITSDEYKNIVDEVRNLGLNNGWVQEAPDGTDPKFFGTNIKPGFI